MLRENDTKTGGLLSGLRAWLRRGYIENSISQEEAIEIGRKYYEERGWRTTEGFCAQESAFQVDGVVEKTYQVGMRVIGGNGFVHVRRSDGKVVGYDSTPR